MSTPFLGELKLFPINFAPKGWAMCNGQLMAINTNQALFSLLGTSYGGDGQMNFALPDLRGRIPLNAGDGLTQGEVIGEESHTLIEQEMPSHLHVLTASTADGDTILGAAALLGSFNNGYRAASALTLLQQTTVSNAGGSQQHENRQPFTMLNWCIALTGIFPSRN